ncbi:hypothetical protein K0M31_007886 [Melipona bicolor]|uniref:Uncharacterized protein n=1 Tax=Melipona bicolor TaxID=60889 RepID=A0AA40GCI7_9HYME|nr:hypothetical protein K0M31_007886 [Melipona bicolor]
MAWLGQDEGPSGASEYETAGHNEATTTSSLLAPLAEREPGGQLLRDLYSQDLPPASEMVASSSLVKLHATIFRFERTVGELVPFKRREHSRAGERSTERGQRLYESEPLEDQNYA